MIYLNAIKGCFGSLTYFISAMTIQDIAKMVSFVKDIHKSKRLSSMIQRSIKGERAKEISSYITKKGGVKFFNSLVLAVYNGTPSWYPATITSTLRTSRNDRDNTEETQSGIISIPSNAKITTIDGQHRLAGIKRAVENNELTEKIIIPVIFISHSIDTKSEIHRRNRTLFTMLNKFSKPVSKFDRIALDEDEAPAIITRQLVENEDSPITEDIISFNKGPNIPPSSADFKTKFTTIETLFDVVQRILSDTHPEGMSASHFRTSRRPHEETLLSYYKWVSDFFSQLFHTYPELKAYITHKGPSSKPSRTTDGGSIFFRPRGLLMFARLFAQSFDGSMKSTFKTLKRIPTDLNEFPYNKTLWINKTIRYSGEAQARNILLAFTSRDRLTPKRRQEVQEYLSQATGKNINLKNFPPTLDGLRKIADLIDSSTQ
ncbi:MAG TPA: DGQHR domain-containing protein [Nitratidesulfovibrio sp.]|nr:DGQHR domain-containing protein [Nitratidesulfovibrio sp.]